VMTSGDSWGEGGRQLSARSAPLHGANPRYILNDMVQYPAARLDVSFAALSDATRRGVLKQLGRADCSITDLAEKFHCRNIPRAANLSSTFVRMTGRQF